MTDRSYDSKTPSGFLQGLDLWAYDTVTSEGGQAEGDTRAVPLMTWCHDKAVPWSVSLRQRQRDYNSADGISFPTDFDSTAYQGGTLRARVTWDDDESAHGEAQIFCDFGALQTLVIPPTPRVSVHAMVGAGFVGAGGSIASGPTSIARAFEAVAYARPTGLGPGGSQSGRTVMLTDWVLIEPLLTYSRRIPRGAKSFWWGSRVIGGGGSGWTANVDYNDAVAVGSASGPMLSEDPTVQYPVPNAASRIRFVNPDGDDQQGCIVWSIEP